MDASTQKGSSHHKHNGRDDEAHLVPGLSPMQYGFPNSIITKLKYCDIITFSPAAGVIAKNLFRANGIFDPDFSGTGHQPMYRDQYAGIYENYVVLGSRIKVTWQGRTNLVGDLVGICGDNDTTTSTTTTTLLEQNNSVHALIADPGGPLTTLYLTYSPEQMIGANQKDEGQAFTLCTADPTDQFIFCVWVQATDGSSVTVVDAVIEIEYTVKFASLLTPVQN